MSRPNAERDWHVQVTDNSSDHFLKSVILICDLDAVDHFSEDDAAHGVEMSSKFQLHQHAIDLIRLGGNVFEEEDSAGGFDLLGRP